ncbi:Cysteine desulfurase [hydrothermal vent metagenome]|uniref:cysteine desulfurase n=1 Tax=hydrothermal vent metagenome TaxID=652676 RepID=A0A3B0SSV6_9ZZZZ
MIYFDHNATTPVKPEVIAETVRVMRDGGNPSSVHGVGRAARAVLEQSRNTIAEMLNCRPQKIIFTAGGTEANNMALNTGGIDHIILSCTEHDSILQAGLNSGRNSGKRLDILPVSENGLVAPDELKECLERTRGNVLVSIMLANNETGVLQDIRQLARISHQAGAIFHTDAIQALGKIPVDFRDLGVDMMSLSAHKVNGPQGAGVLVALEKIKIQSPASGGRQENGRRCGTENLAGIAGFAMAVSLLPQNLKSMDNIRIMRDRIEGEISHHAPEARFYGAGAPRLANTTTILMPDVASETQVMAFDLAGICVSSGSACSSGKVKPSHVVTAMGGTMDQALSTIRVSLGWNNTEQQVDEFIAAWKKLYNRKRQ